jgi:hypothetical protein
MKIRALILALTSLGALPAFACENPTLVPVPDGKTATMEQLVATQAQIKEFMAAMEQYMACLDDAATAAGDDAPAEYKAMMANRHNIAVGEEEAIAKRFNEQVKAYKAANPAEKSEKPE